MLNVDCIHFKDMGAEVVCFCLKFKTPVVARRDCIGVGYKKCREPISLTINAKPIPPMARIPPRAEPRPAAPPKPKLWPKWAASLRAIALPADAGAGDTAAREIDAIGLAEFRARHGITFGPSCSCDAREWNEQTRAKWNERWAYARP